MGTGSTPKGVQETAPKLIVLGWDAATWDLLSPWVAEGKLPNLAKLMQSGSYGSIRSTSLPVSPAAWSTIITGQNPAKHGVFDWFARKEGSYDVEYVHTGQIKAKPVWSYFNEAGKRIGVFNLPMLYPAVPLDGFMFSGLAAPDAASSGFAYPAELIQELEENVGPFWHAETEVYKYGREDAYLENVLELLDYQKRVVDYLVREHPCDVYLLVFMQTDHVQHKFWRYIDPMYPEYDSGYDAQFQDAILQVYQGVDEQLGDLLAAFGDDTNFVVLSDHGGGPVHGIMYINRWLHEIGMLHLRDDISTRAKFWLAKRDLIGKAYRIVSKIGLGKVANLVSKPARNKVLNSFMSFDDIDWTRTKAYARGAFGQIYVNQKGREPSGIVEPGTAYEQVVTQLIAALEKLPHPKTGEPLITDIYRKSEIFNGPYLENAADVIFSIQNYLFQSSVKMGLDSESILGKSEYEDSGSHRADGIVVMSGPGIAEGVSISDASIADILPTMLALAGLPVPDDLDGLPLSQAFTESQKHAIKFVSGSSDSLDGTTTPNLDDSELTEIEDRLRSLGYLG
ncbi:MAG: alkaline phosphatase family protein [Anaerolineales bacterium]|nr:alkaline phosphatase family protein [Chloroflexota bacterium]MBL6980226.1 alkaline phosphatase family protein [Anaerolineales bacterium]